MEGSQPMSTAVHKSPNKFWRSNSILNLCTGVSRHLPLQPQYRSQGGQLVESQPSQVSLHKEDEFKKSSLYLLIAKRVILEALYCGTRKSKEDNAFCLWISFRQFLPYRKTSLKCRLCIYLNQNRNVRNSLMWNTKK